MAGFPDVLNCVYFSTCQVLVLRAHVVNMADFRYGRISLRMRE